MKDSKISRADALKGIIVLPALAGALAAGAGSVAWAADNKKQFRYQDKPGPRGEQCSQCRFFRAPKGCTIVNGVISPHAWCIAWAKKR